MYVEFMTSNQRPVTAAPPSSVVDIWLVEDNDSYRRSVQSVLDGTGSLYCSHAFSSCEAALEALEVDSPPSVVLLDIGLPGISGIEGIERIKSLSPSSAIVILTVYDDDDNLFSAICAGASGYLLKDSPKDSIIEAINEVRSGGAPMNPWIAKKAMAMLSRFGATPKPQTYGLTVREVEVLEILVEGKTKKEIADKLFVSFHTVNTHLKNIYVKLHVNTRGSVISKAINERLV